jgi:hypothetical protein
MDYVKGILSGLAAIFIAEFVFFWFFANWESTMSDVGEQYAVVVVLASGTHSLEAACFAR